VNIWGREVERQDGGEMENEMPQNLYTQAKKSFPFSRFVRDTINKNCKRNNQMDINDEKV
jgi:hypothetical protein